ncbi:hypothetical protein DSM112329_02828 [Paraconexibacter sp. AEG42_29]|uniref:Lipoprotein n=1 Tax=Paraconexibacter sp. AEG42_29 TaxID=2997339 RepID=A0AAU7AXA9_9ACTN
MKRAFILLIAAALSIAACGRDGDTTTETVTATAAASAPDPQTPKSIDADAKSNARNMVTRVEVCYVDTTDYDECLSGSSQLDDPENTDTLVEESPNGYRVVSKSMTGNTFTITKDADAANGYKLTCTDDGYRNAGCRNGTW